MWSSFKESNRINAGSALKCAYHRVLNLANTSYLYMIKRYHFRNLNTGFCAAIPNWADPHTACRQYALIVYFPLKFGDWDNQKFNQIRIIVQQDCKYIGDGFWQNSAVQSGRRSTCKKSQGHKWAKESPKSNNSKLPLTPYRTLKP